MFSILYVNNVINFIRDNDSLMKEIKHHFRDKYGKDEMKNCMHSSDSLDNVKRESKIILHRVLKQA